MSASVPTLFTETTLDGFPLWVVLLICGGEAIALEAADLLAEK